jgi:hypothetical protein
MRRTRRIIAFISTIIVNGFKIMPFATHQQTLDVSTVLAMAAFAGATLDGTVGQEHLANATMAITTIEQLRSIR